MTSPDACLPGQRSPRARRSFAGSDFVSIFWLQALSSLHSTTIGTRRRRAIRAPSVSQKLVRSLTRPFKVDLDRDVQSSLDGVGEEGGLDEDRGATADRPRLQLSGRPLGRSTIDFLAVADLHNVDDEGRIDCRGHDPASTLADSISAPSSS